MMLLGQNLGGPICCTKRFPPYGQRKAFPRSARRLLVAFASSNEPSSSSSSVASSTKPPATLDAKDVTVSVGDENVPLEGVIQFEKPNSQFSSVDKWGRIAFLAGGDAMALFAFAAIGRFGHGLPVFEYETLRTADPFIAGWFFGAYFCGAYGDDGRVLNGYSKALFAAAKSWALGIPLGLVIRAATLGHVPPYTFALVTLGSTAVLLIGWRALSSKLLSSDDSKKADDYKRGSPFELFELLTSLIRRW